MVNANCEFSVDGSFGYACTINHLFVNNVSEQLSITGAHLPGHDDSKVLYMKFNNTALSHIPNDFFDKFRNLKRFDCSKVRLLSIGELKNCTNLEVLIVNDNILSELKVKSLSVCHNLRQIWAQRNRIKYLEPGLLSQFQFLERGHFDFNLLEVLKDDALHTASKILSLSFNANQLERIEGSLNSTASIEYLSFIGNIRLKSMDPQFLYGFTGRIGELNFRDVPCMPKTQFFNVNAVSAFDVRDSLGKCFQNFEPTEPPTEPPVIGELLCKLDPSKSFYNCETKAKLIVIDEL